MPFDSVTGASLPGAFCPCAHRQRAVIQRPLFNTGKSRIPTYKLTCGAAAREASRIGASTKATNVTRTTMGSPEFGFTSTRLYTTLLEDTPAQTKLQVNLHGFTAEARPASTTALPNRSFVPQSGHRIAVHRPPRGD